MYKNVEMVCEEDLTIFTFKKSLDFQEFIEIFKGFYNANPTKYIIFDMSRGDLKNITPEQIEIASETLKNNFHKRPAGAKTAFVVLGFDDLGVLKSYRFWNIIKDVKLNSKIFHNYNDAIEWIRDGFRATI